MPSRTVTVGSASGLHARPAALFVAAAGAQSVAVTIRTADKAPVPARSTAAAGSRWRIPSITCTALSPGKGSAPVTSS